MFLQLIQRDAWSRHCKYDEKIMFRKVHSCCHDMYSQCFKSIVFFSPATDMDICWRTGGMRLVDWIRNKMKEKNTIKSVDLDLELLILHHCKPCLMITWLVFEKMKWLILASGESIDLTNSMLSRWKFS